MSRTMKTFCGECGITENPIVRQCIMCGCPVCEECSETHDGGTEAGTDYFGDQDRY